MNRWNLTILLASLGCLAILGAWVANHYMDLRREQIAERREKDASQREQARGTARPSSLPSTSASGPVCAGFRNLRWGDDPRTDPTVVNPFPTHPEAGIDRYATDPRHLRIGETTFLSIEYDSWRGRLYRVVIQARDLDSVERALALRFFRTEDFPFGVWLGVAPDGNPVIATLRGHVLTLTYWPTESARRHEIWRARYESTTRQAGDLLDLIR
jgi:hypothetical protein